MTDTATIVSVVVVALAIAGAITDARTGKIPNLLTYPFIFGAPLVFLAIGGLQGFLDRVLAIFLCAIVPYLVFRRGGGGGGDVKLFAAIGAVGGIGLGLEVQFFGFIIATLYALGRLTWHGQMWRTIGNAFRLGMNPLLPKRMRGEVTAEMMTPIRIGIPVALGTLFAVLSRHVPLLMH